MEYYGGIWHLLEGMEGAQGGDLFIAAWAMIDSHCPCSQAIYDLPTGKALVALTLAPYSRAAVL